MSENNSKLGIQNSELLPCPFCGGTNVLMCGALGNHHVQCYGCGATTAKFRYMARAAGAWNRRNNVSAERAEFAQILAGLVSRGTITQADVDRLGRETIKNSEFKILDSAPEVPA